MIRIRTLAVVSLLGVLLAGMAHADIIFELKNDPQPDEQNILFNNNQIGSFIVGFSNATNNEVDFSSVLNTLQVKSNGQAQIFNANGGNTNDIYLTAPGATFNDFIVDLNAAKDSVIDIMVFANDGAFPFQFIGTNGSNFVTILAQNGETINAISFKSDAGWKVFKQPRISGLANNVAVPEPSSLLLLGTGAVALAGTLRRRFRA